MAAQHKAPRYRTDWFRVIVELQRLGKTMPGIAEAIEVPLSTVKHWKCRSEPGYEHGRLLLQMWANETGKTLQERPTCWG